MKKYFIKRRCRKRNLVINSENSGHAYPRYVLKAKGDLNWEELSPHEYLNLGVGMATILREYFSKRAFARTHTLRGRYGHYNEEAGGI
jgi:hypothetical protein